MRAEIAALGKALAAVKTAPPTRDEQRQHVENYVVQLYRQARPTVGIVGDRLRVGFRGDTALIEDTAALLCWLAPAAFEAALLRELPEQADAMPKAEREREVARLEGQLLELEHRAEALISRAGSEGVKRRSCCGARRGDHEDGGCSRMNFSDMRRTRNEAALRTSSLSDVSL
jgi:hypothetical protein